MLIFNEKELAWIKKELTYVLAEENKDCVEYVDEEDLAKARTVLDKIELVNSDEIINEMFIDVLWFVMGMWIWEERLDDPENQIDNYVDDSDYCNVYRKTMEYLNDEEDEENE